MTHEFNDDDAEKIHSVDQINKNLLMEGTVRIDKGPMTPHPTNWGWRLEEDSFGLPKGANKMYRSGEPHNTIQVREYDDHYLVQLDHAHPTQNPVAHYKLDMSPGQKAGIAIAALAVGTAILAALS
jgi:hypothetical protein